MAKALLSQAIRSVAEWAAVVEAEPTSPDAGGWRADVLAPETVGDESPSRPSWQP